MPIQETDLVRNGFFTYYVATKKDNTQTAETRKLDQIFNHDGITVQVQGEYTRKGSKALNCFAKKHLLATRTGGKDADAKATSVHSKRLNPMSVLASRNAKLKALKNAGGSNLSYGTQPTKDVYGSKLEKKDTTSPDPSSTFFLIDGLTPDQVRAVFTSAIKGKCTVDADTEVELHCGSGHLWQYVEGKVLDKTSFTKMKVSVFFDGTKYNVHHCAGPA
jgi:hypothetical protein